MKKILRPESVNQTAFSPWVGALHSANAPYVMSDRVDDIMMLAVTF